MSELAGGLPVGHAMPRRARFGQGRTAEAIQVLSSVPSGVISHTFMQSQGARRKPRNSWPKVRFFTRTAAARNNSLWSSRDSGTGTTRWSDWNAWPASDPFGWLYPEQSGVRVPARRPASENPAQEGGVAGIGFMR
jgi:poly(3-hydroxybutyrate) depolymerase